MRITAFWLRMIPALFFLLLVMPVLAQPDPDELDKQIALLKSDNPDFRKNAAVKLLRMRDPRGMEPLLAFMFANDEYVLEYYKEDFLKLPREVVWNPLLIVIGECDEKNLERSLIFANNFSKNYDSARYFQAMEDADPRVRAGALRALVMYKYEDWRVLKVALERLKDPAGIVRAMAVRVAAGLVDDNRNMDGSHWTPPQPPRGTPPLPKDEELIKLIIAMAKDPDACVRAAVMEVAPRFDKTILRVGCEDVEGVVRAAAYDSLLSIKPIIEDELKAFKDASPLVRVKAMKFASKFDDQRVRDAILAAAGDADAGVRAAAFRQIWMVKNPAKVTELALAGLKDADPIVRASAIGALGRNGDTKTWLPALEPLLKDEHPQVKRAAARALLVSKDKAHVDQYLEMLNDPDIAYEAIRVLGYLRDPRAVVPLMRMMPDEEKARAESIETTLFRIGQSAEEEILALNWAEYINVDNGATAFQIPVLNGNPCMVERIDALWRSENHGERLLALNMMTLLDDVRWEPVLLAELENPSFGEETPIYDIIQSLDGSRNPGLAKVLIKYVKGFDGMKGEETEDTPLDSALRALSRCDDPAAVDFLADRLRNGDENMLEWMGYEFSPDDSRGPYGNKIHQGFLNDPRTISILLRRIVARAKVRTEKGVKMISFEDYQMEWKILYAIDNPKAKEALHAALRDKDQNVRLVAAITLGRFDIKAATPILLRHLTEGDLNLCLNVVEALASFGDVRALPVLADLMRQNVMWERGKRVAEAMAKCGKPAIPFLLDMMKDKRATNDELFSRVIDLLTDLGYPRVYEALLEKLKSGYPDVVQAALNRLIKHNDPRTLESLRAEMNRNNYIERDEPILKARLQLNDPTAKKEVLSLCIDKHLRVNAEIIALTHDPALYQTLLDGYNLLRKEQLISTESAVPPNEAAYREGEMVLFQRQVYDPNPSEMPDYIKALGVLGDKRAVDILLAGMNEEMENGVSDMNVRYGDEPTPLIDVYIEALGNLRDARAVQPILQALEIYASDQYIAAEALGKIGDSRAVPAILRAAHACGIVSRHGVFWYSGGCFDSEIDDDGYFTRALGAFRDEASADALKAALKSPMWRTRAIASEALGIRDEGWAIAELTPLLKDAQPQVREAAGAALDRLGK